MPLVNRVLITPPSDEPLTLDEVKGHLRLPASDVEDEELLRYITAARRYVEQIGGLAFLEQTWELSQERFPCHRRDTGFSSFVLPGYPLKSVTSIKYQDTNNVQQTVSSTVYTVDTAAQPGMVHLAYAQDWPPALYVPNSVVVKYVCGYSDVSSIPEDLRQTLLLAVGSLYEFREDLIVGTATSTLPHSTGLLDRLLGSYRSWA